MKADEAIDFYGTQGALAQALGIRQPSVARWAKTGRVPALQQIRLEKLTKGRLKADPKVFKPNPDFCNCKV